MEQSFGNTVCHIIVLVYRFNIHRLPYAPSMKIYCVYGHGKETEVSFDFIR